MGRPDRVPRGERVAWQRVRGRVVGARRMGGVARICDRRDRPGPRGLALQRWDRMGASCRRRPLGCAAGRGRRRGWSPADGRGLLRLWTPRAGTWTWTSDDGVGWSAERFLDGLGAVQDGIGPEQAGEPWLLVGTISKSGSGTRVPVVWSSRDRLTWEQLELPSIASFDPWEEAIIRAGQGYVAVAFDLPTVNGATWVSTDGARWIALAAAPLIQIAADGPAGIIGLGVPRDDGAMPVYGLR